MSAFHDVILAGASGSQGYQISRSVRLRSSASAYFNRTPASAGNQKTWTWSGWVKSGVSDASIFSAYGGSGLARCEIRISGSQLQVFNYNTSSAYDWTYQTNAVYRDPSAWYHFVVVVDSTASTGNRVKMWVNGVQVTSWASSSEPSLNFNSYVNAATPTYIGKNAAAAAYCEAYLTEINFIDGQALTPSSFGETDAVTGVWKPKKYAGTYGTNGFYLNFSDNSNNTAATIGKDYSGNGNNWTPNNISVTSGVTYDSMLDVPTPYADGGNGRGNYATWNPLDKRISGASTFADGNLAATVGASGSTEEASATITFPSSGSWYCEITCSNVASGNARIGIGNSATAIDSRYASGYLYQQDGQKYVLGSASAYGSSYTTGNVIGIAFDASAGSITFYKDNTSQGAITGISTSSIWVITATGKATVWTANFGQRPFAYTPPTGFKALNTQNLPAPSILKGNAYFDATLYTGTGSSLSITNSGSMQPDLVWVKGRSGATDHALYDAVRGVQKQLESNTTTAETTETTGLTAFNSNGFTVGALAQMNTNAATYVGWQWKAGGTSSSNTDGSITSTVSVNPTAGFSVVTYTGNGSASATVGHGLGVTPSMVIIKQRNGVNDWWVKHSSLATNLMLILDSTSATYNGTLGGGGGIADLTSSSTFGFVNGTSNVNNVNASGGTFVAYCWSQIAGFSKFGSYTGNGSADGPFVYCGFRPSYVLIKNTQDGTQSWIVYDAARNAYNVGSNLMQPNSSAAEALANANTIDFLSNGFKLRSSNAATNTTQNYIFAAFAEVSTKYALAR